MYQYYEERRRPSARRRILRATLIICVLVLGVVATLFLLNWGKVERPVSEVGGIKQVSSVKNANIAVYDGNGWKTQFWNGVNMGASLPGHSPGELAPAKEDYLRWFAQMKEMNVDERGVQLLLAGRDPGQLLLDPGHRLAGLAQLLRRRARRGAGLGHRRGWGPGGEGGLPALEVPLHPAR